MFLKNWRGGGRHTNIYLLLPEKCFSGQLLQFSQNSLGFSTVRLISQETSFFWANKSNWSPVAQMVKNLPVVWKTWVWSLGWEDPLEKGMATYSSILAWRIHGQRSLAGYSPWVHKELDMTEWLTSHNLYCFQSSLRMHYQCITSN